MGPALAGQAIDVERLHVQRASRSRKLEKEPNKIELDPGEYDPMLGHSYTEIAGMSRSMHRSQGMGTAEREARIRTTS